MGLETRHVFIYLQSVSVLPHDTISDLISDFVSCKVAGTEMNKREARTGWVATLKIAMSRHE